jgi:hypothetical protein
MKRENRRIVFSNKGKFFIQRELSNGRAKWLLSRERFTPILLLSPVFYLLPESFTTESLPITGFSAYAEKQGKK